MLESRDQLISGMQQTYDTGNLFPSQSRSVIRYEPERLYKKRRSSSIDAEAMKAREYYAKAF